MSKNKGETESPEFVEALALTLHGHQVGVLSHHSNGRNRLTFNPAYQALPDDKKPVVTLTQRVNSSYLDKPLSNAQRIPPVLSNLLPEGALREWISSSLKVHPSHEFALLTWLGRNLPGALIAEAILPGEIPAWALTSKEKIEPIQINPTAATQKFSLAGVQMKFSSLRADGRFNISADMGEDSWIIKTPSTVHKNVPTNEYSAMKLAEAIGVTIPEIELVPLNSLNKLPDIQLPNETLAYAIRRFDRDTQGRIHTEDFAQIFGLYAHDKYGKRNYEQIASSLYHYGEEGLEDSLQLARRLLANILLANGDAHLKNWTIIYPDGISPRLAPAYDIVSTLPYVEGESDIALNLGKQKNWHAIDMETFQTWAKRTGLPWPAIKIHLLDAITSARELWPEMLKDLPMLEQHKDTIKTHWTRLSDDFRIF